MAMSAQGSLPTGCFRLLKADDWTDYELLDSGEGRKLERYGQYLFDRPDAQALWPTRIPRKQWTPNGIFASGSGGDDEDRGAWRFPDGPPNDHWPVKWNGLTANARCAAFRHMGLFPEHSVHWSWAMEKIRRANRPVRVLNLFGYTGMMSLACAQAGAEVVHIDASPKSIGFGRENQELSHLGDRTIRWICEDALRFVQREARRGRYYDGVILDPPKYGRGPKKEVWQLSENLDDLLQSIRAVLSPDPLFMILTIYAVRLSYLSVGQLLSATMRGLGGGIEWGEMTLVESKRDVLLPTAVYARWSRDDLQED